MAQYDPNDPLSQDPSQQPPSNTNNVASTYSPKTLDQFDASQQALANFQSNPNGGLGQGAAAKVAGTSAVTSAQKRATAAVEDPQHYDPSKFNSVQAFAAPSIDTSGYDTPVGSFSGDLKDAGTYANLQLQGGKKVTQGLQGVNSQADATHKTIDEQLTANTENLRKYSDTYNDYLLGLGQKQGMGTLGQGSLFDTRSLNVNQALARNSRGGMGALAALGYGNASAYDAAGYQGDIGALQDQATQNVADYQTTQNSAADRISSFKDLLGKYTNGFNTESAKAGDDLQTDYQKALTNLTDAQLAATDKVNKWGTDYNTTLSQGRDKQVAEETARQAAAAAAKAKADEAAKQAAYVEAQKKAAAAASPPLLQTQVGNVGKLPAIPTGTGANPGVTGGKVVSGPTVKLPSAPPLYLPPQLWQPTSVLAQNPTVKKGVEKAENWVSSVFSDERTKTNVEDGSHAVREFLDNVKPYAYEYKSEEFGAPGQHVSPMAQDLEKSEIGKKAISYTPEGLRMVAYNELAPGMMAALGDLHSRLKKAGI